MLLRFDEKDPGLILEAILAQFAGKSLDRYVDFNMAEEEIMVTIKKMGRSHLVFTWETGENGLTLRLKSEKIALAHRAFRNEVANGILRVLQEAGGQVIGDS